MLQSQLEDALAEVGTLQASLAEARKDADAADKEARHARRMLRIAMAQSQITETTSASLIPARTSVEEQQVPVQIPVPVPAATAIPVAAAAPAIALVETAVDPEAVERLKRLEDGIKELLQWKQVASAPVQPVTNQAPRSWNDSEAAEAVDISPRATTTAPVTEGSSSQAVQNILNDIKPQNTLQKHPSSNLTAAAVSSSSVSTATLPHPPPLTNLHVRSASTTPPLYSPAPTSPQKHQQGTPTSPLPPSSPAIKRQFLRDLPHEAVGHERPGVISRFPHPLSDLRAVRQELQAELESELVSELAAQGIHDPEGCRGLTPAEYLSCMEALQQSRAAAANQMNEQDKAREQYMRNTVTWHVDSVTKSVAAATKPATGIHSPPPLPMPPQTRPQLRPTALRVKTTVTPPPIQTTGAYITNTNPSSMEPSSPVNLEDRDQETDAFYSPLRRGHSTNEGMMMPGSSPGSPSRQQLTTLVI